MMDFDFTGKTVLVVGGSSGIGNGVAHALQARGAEVHVWGTRKASDYRAEDGSDLTGLRFAQLDVSDFAAVARAVVPFERLDVLVTCQGAVAYGRKEFEMETFSRIVDVNLNSVMACCMKFESMLAATKGATVVFGSTAGYHTSIGNPAYAASKAAVLKAMALKTMALKKSCIATATPIVIAAPAGWPDRPRRVRARRRGRRRARRA